IHPLKIRRRRLDAIVDLKSKMFVTRSYQRLSNCRGSFPDWQGLPIPGFGLCDQSIELVLSSKDSAERQARFRCKRRRTKENQGYKDFPTSHNPHNSTPNSVSINSCRTAGVPGDIAAKGFASLGRTYILCRTVPIRFPKKSRRNVVRESPDSTGVKRSTRVRLRPRADWHKRNFLTSVLIPSLFVKRAGRDAPPPPQFPKIRGGEICVTWIGHASFLIQTHEANVLIDPNWSKWLKVIKRLKQPGFEIHHLPSIDFVLVTHAHFDHLDRRTLRRVAADQPIVVPMGVGNLVHDLGFHIVHELDYWQTVELGPLKISLTPCHHWGARFLADLHRDFGGFVIAANGRTIFHCGDSAYFPGFREIGDRYKIEIAL